MRIIHQKGFEEDERIQIKAVIYSNVIMAVRVLLEIMSDNSIEYSNDNTVAYGEYLEKTSSDVDAHEAFRDGKVQEAMNGMWADRSIWSVGSRSETGSFPVMS